MLQEVGREFGTTTGRRRRCGWLDLVVLRHSCLINGYDALNLTKLDILSSLAEIKVAVEYSLDGDRLEGFPGKFHRNWRRIGSRLTMPQLIWTLFHESKSNT